MEQKRQKEIPEQKIKLVAELAGLLKKNRTIIIASTRKLPSSQFHQIKKNLRGTADIRVARKTAVLRAIDAVQKPGIQKLKESIQADVALFFSARDAFELSGILADNQSPARAKAGDVASEDIHIEPGPTDLVPGPAISELSGVGLKVAVEGGKLAIKQPATIVKAGEAIKPNVASVLGKLNILPMRVGFEPLAAYDSQEDKVYIGIKIDKKGILEQLRYDIGKARGFAINLTYACADTIAALLHKAARHEKALASKSSAPEQTAPAEGVSA
ncbi:50S ribosomal protein L10 [Candidatus Pacearchaeota archaeon]|nr:50S ribosomal protein L10 [Candidatus Pacearchaeota archaeon]